MSAARESLAEFRFETRAFYWRGPSPFFFAPIPPAHVEELRRLSRIVSYGWGMLPVEAQIGDIVFETALYPKDETYLLPLKAAVRRKANITAGDMIAVVMTTHPPEG